MAKQKQRIKTQGKTSFLDSYYDMSCVVSIRRTRGQSRQKARSNCTATLSGKKKDR